MAITSKFSQISVAFLSQVQYATPRSTGRKSSPSTVVIRREKTLGTNPRHKNFTFIFHRVFLYFPSNARNRDQLVCLMHRKKAVPPRPQAQRTEQTRTGQYGSPFEFAVIPICFFPFDLKSPVRSSIFLLLWLRLAIWIWWSCAGRRFPHDTGLRRVPLRSNGEHVHWRQCRTRFVRSIDWLIDYPEFPRNSFLIFSGQADQGLVSRLFFGFAVFMILLMLFYWTAQRGTVHVFIWSSHGGSIFSLDVSPFLFHRDKFFVFISTIRTRFECSITKVFQIYTIIYLLP